MKKLMLMLLIMCSLAVVAGPGHKKSDWAEELGLTEAQAKEMKSIKKANYEKMKAYKKELAEERDAQFATILSEEQMAKLKEMRKKHKKHKKHKKYKKERGE